MDYTELYRAVHRELSAIRNNGVSAFQGEVFTGRIGPIVGDFRKCPHNRGVRFSGVSARRGSTVLPVRHCARAKEVQCYSI